MRQGDSASVLWPRERRPERADIELERLVYSIADDRAKVQRLGKLGVDVADLPLY